MCMGASHFSFYFLERHVKYKTKKTLRDVGLADQKKAGKQCRDDSIKLFSMHVEPYPTYLSTLKIHRMGLHTELRFFWY